MTVTMSTATAGATIFYTVGNSTPPAPTHTGSTPTGSTLVYSGPINVDWQVYEEFKAIAYKAGMTDSNVTSFVADNRGIQGPQSGSTSSSSAIVFSVWDGDWALLEEYGTENTLLESYVQGLHGLVKTVVSNIYYYQDSLGSTSHIANASGQLLESYRYDLYGKPLYFDAAGNPLPNGSGYAVRDLFAGQRWMPELGLYDDRNRFMSPDLGRFLQPDPVGFKGDASNLYRYCGNDWANKTDPMGLQAAAGDNLQEMKDSEDQQGENATQEERRPGVTEALAKSEASKSEGAIAVSAREHQSASFNVSSEIRRPDNQPGMKTNQTVTVDQNGTWSQSSSSGSTKFLGANVPGIFIPYANVSPIKGTSSSFSITMRGYALSVPLVVGASAAIGPASQALLSIHYSFHGVVNFGARTASLSGWHSSYPSFSGRISGRSVFDRPQSRPPLVGLVPGAEVWDQGSIGW